MELPGSVFGLKTARQGRRALPCGHGVIPCIRACQCRNQGLTPSNGTMVGLDVPASRFGRGVQPARLKFMTTAALMFLSASAAAQEVDPASLSRLHDIVVPEAVSWWPPGPAWAVVGYLLVAVVLGLGIRAWRKWKANRYRRLALRELAEVERSHGADSAIEAVPALLKRTALVAYGRPTVASLSGETWYRFLQGSSRAFREAEKPADFFMSLAYEPDAAARLTTEDRAAIFRATRSWIRSHRVDGIEAKEELEA